MGKDSNMCGSRLRPCRARATVQLHTAPIGPAWATLRREYLRRVEVTA